MLTRAVCYEKQPFWKILFVCTCLCDLEVWGEDYSLCCCLDLDVNFGPCHLHSSCVAPWHPHSHLWVKKNGCWGGEGTGVLVHRWPGHSLEVSFHGCRVTHCVSLSQHQNCPSVRVRTNRPRSWDMDPDSGLGTESTRSEQNRQRENAMVPVRYEERRLPNLSNG